MEVLSKGLSKMFGDQSGGSEMITIFPNPNPKQRC